MKIKIPKNLKRIENPLRFTIGKLSLSLLSLLAVMASAYLFYLIIMALRKYIGE